MNQPSEHHWLRVEELSEQLSALPPDQVPARIAQLAVEGEPHTVLTLLETMVDLPPLPQAVDTGTVIAGRYVLRKKLGQGAMGMVWRARQELVGRDVAVKIIHPWLVTPAFESRFLAEVEILGQLNHPGIARIFDAGFHEQDHGPPVPFFAMELIEGLALNRWAEEHRKDRNALLQLIMAVCSAIQSAHERRIVHRDLKPGNILVKTDGQPVVVDFGIARLAGVIKGEEPGLFSGTLSYAAPEQYLGCDGNFRSGESVDVYAVGVILFEILTGHRLFEFFHGATIADMRRLTLEGRVPRLSEALPGCPPLLEDLVSRALRRDPADRFYSMAAFGRAIGRAIEPNDRPSAPPPWTPAANQVVPGTQWRLVEKIGEGGTGEVWSGRHDELGERRVFKFCDSEDKARTLKRELTLYRLLKGQVGFNRHFIQLYDVSLDDPPWYLMMEQVDAHDLDVWCEKQTGGPAHLAEDVRLEIIAQTAEALQAAHEAGILHRDIKPANLLVKGSPQTGEIHVYITDFGIGQIIVEGLLRKGTLLGFTRTVSNLDNGPLSGTLLYVAPEVLEGNAATIRSDIYSLGVVFWQMMIGNLHAAMDPAEGLLRIGDPLLREDLARCIAGSPEKRWSSAGELAMRLRDLSGRRAAVAARQRELAARERAAYRQGVLKTAAVALALILIFATVAVMAWVQSREARRAHGEIALRQAAMLKQTDFAPGRKVRGMNLLDAAVRRVTDAGALRTAAAAVLGMSDLVPLPAEKTGPQAGVAPNIPKQPNELFRTQSHDGTRVAVARDLDGLNGTIDLFDAGGGHIGAIERKQFPWVPLAEPELLRFSPNDQLLAVGGAATSRHILICNVSDGSLRTYLFHGADPLCCAWHAQSRFIAVGCADDAIRIWDVTASVEPASTATLNNQFDLPPALDIPAQDHPLYVLRGHRGPVVHLAFSPNGRWLAALDALGYLRIYLCFFPDNLLQIPGSDLAAESAAGQSSGVPVFADEVRLDHAETVTGLDAGENEVLIRHAGGTVEEFKFVPGELPMEINVERGLTGVAWNGNGTGLCAMTLNNVDWLRAAPLAFLQEAAGENPFGISSEAPEGGWLIAKDLKLTEWRRSQPGQEGNFAMAGSFKLSEAREGQAEHTSLAACGDGRAALYCGKRIQFYCHGRLAPLDTSVVAGGGNGDFKEIFWDHSGQLLGVSFALPNGSLRVETWQTSTNFPPQCHACPPLVLDCQSVAPANDGRHFIARGGDRGLWQIDPANGAQINLDTSSLACQSAPFASSCDGSLVAMVVDQTIIRLLAFPSGKFFADLGSPRPAGLTGLAWDASGAHLASMTDDGFIQVWNLSSWQEWMASHGLEK